MLGTSTHDTKRGEDTRARLAVLSDMPEEWGQLVNTWSRLLRARRGDIEGNAPPDRNDEYLLYQLLVGSWPVELLEETDTASLENYGKRLAGALEKSMREAKLHSTWTSPDTVYEEAMQALARDALDFSRGGFLASFLPFAQKIARLGVQNSIVQTVMKLTLPGVPDIYQGCEMWDLSLVDPDNRRPVDYERRAATLTELRGKLDTMGDRKALLAEMLESWQDAKVKLAVTTLLLDLRRMQEALFETGGYEALTIEGQKSERVLGYMRSGGGESVAVLVARFPGLRELDPNWSGTTVSLPDGRWTDWLTGHHFEGGAVNLANLFETLPAVVLVQPDLSCL